MKMATFFLLYIAQSVPMSFFSTVIPVIMRQEQFSLASIGLLPVSYTHLTLPTIA